MQANCTFHKLPRNPRQYESKVGSEHIYYHYSSITSKKSRVVHKSRTQREAIIQTERSGGTGGRYTVPGRSDRQIQNMILRAFDGVRILDTAVEIREDMAIIGCSGIYDDNLSDRSRRWEYIVSMLRLDLD